MPPEAKLEAHSLSLLFPQMTKEEFASLKASIKEQGLLEPLMLFEGKILDGRHRYKACQQLGIPLEHSEFSGSEEEALAFALAKNATKRHLSTSQKALIAARLVQPRGRPKKEANLPLFSLEESSLKVGVSERSVKQGIALLKNGSAPTPRPPTTNPPTTYHQPYRPPERSC